MKPIQISIRAVTLVIAMTFFAQSVSAYVQVRISIKFIVNASGNRPVCCNLWTDGQINTEVDWGNKILGDNMSELRLDLLDLVDLPGVSQWYTAVADLDGVNMNNLRAAAINNPTLYRWRTDAVNIYINAGSGSAVSAYSPNNDIILMNQRCDNTPSCILHELGHSLNLRHTHEAYGDLCADTIQDDKSWTRDQIAQNNFGKSYANLTAAEQDQVNLVYNNVMSYHLNEPQLRFSACQKDRMSSQADDNRGWLLSREPLYVYSANSGTQSGRFQTPYQTLQSAMDAGLSGKVVVLEQGSYPVSTAISNDTIICTRTGPSTVNKQGAQLYELPVDLENSKNPEVSRAIRAVQEEDTTVRNIMRKAKEEAQKVQNVKQRATIMAESEAKQEVHSRNAMNYLAEAERYASGNEKIAIQLVLARRYQYARNCDQAIKYYKLVAESTDQKYLREEALRNAEECQKKLTEGLR
jgi:hypothetical protein